MDENGYSHSLNLLATFKVEGLITHPLLITPEYFISYDDSMEHSLVNYQKCIKEHLTEDKTVMITQTYGRDQI